MRCTKPNTDQTCEVYCSTTERTYAEYMLDPELDGGPSKPNILEAFIPVHDGERITVNIKFEGTVLHGAFDVLADGAFVFDRRIEGDHKGQVKHQRRDWHLKEVYNVPGSLDVKTMHSSTAVVGGNLTVKALDDDDKPLYVKHGGKLGLGSIAVIVSVNQDSSEQYGQSYASQTVGSWRSRTVNQADGGIIPDHELEFSLEDDDISMERQQRHKRHGEQTRFGLKPWAVFVFHYRSQAAIQQAGCVPRPTSTLQLEPFHGDFTFADPEASMKKRLDTRARNVRLKRESESVSESGRNKHDFAMDGEWEEDETRSVSEDGDNGGSLFVSQRPSARSNEMPQQSFSAEPMEMQEHARKDSRFSDAEMAALPSVDPAQHREAYELFGTAADPYNSIPGLEEGADFDFSTFPDLTGGELVGEIEQMMSGTGYDAPGAPAGAPVANMYPSQPMRESAVPPEPVQSTEITHRGQQPPAPQAPQPDTSHPFDEEQAESSPLAQMISSAVQGKVTESKAAKQARNEAHAAKRRVNRPSPVPKGKPLHDPTAKTGYGYGNPKLAPGQPMAPGSSQAPTHEKMQQLGATEKQTHDVLGNYLREQSGVVTQQQYGSLPKPSTSQPYQRPWEPAQKPQVKTTPQHPMSPPIKAAQPNMNINTTHRTMPSPSPRPAQPAPLALAPVPALQTLKREASVTSLTSSTASKKARTDHEAKMAAIRAQLAEKRKATETAKQSLEAERNARADVERQRKEAAEREEREREEAEAAEMAALQAELAREAEEEREVIETRKRESEEATMRELEWRRESGGE